MAKTKVEEAPIVNDLGTQDEAPTPTEKETVSVGVEEIRALLKKVAELEENQKDLMKTAPSDQIARIEALRRQGKLVKSVKLSSIDGKLVIGWKLIKDDTYFEGTRLVEIQTVRVFLEDSTVEEMSMRDFTRRTSVSSFEVIREAKDNDGDIFVTIMKPDGKEVTISQRYVN